VSRRTLTLLLSGLLTVVLTVGASATAVPYVAYEPGPTFNTIGSEGSTPVITVSGRQTYPTDGHLDLTTISVQPRLTLLEAVRDWFDPDRAVVPREFVYPPGQSSRQVDQENQQAKLDSENAATTAALRTLGIPFTTAVEVQAVDKALPAAGKLQPGDALTALDGTPVTTSQGVRDVLGGRPVGSPVTVAYTRGGAPATVTITTAKAPSGPARSIIGVTLLERPKYPFSITISLQDVGGPSAGLMFTLGIIDKLLPESLTGGRYIAGTGTVSGDGTVGPIGGIPQKLRGARDKGATVFLVPADNCAEALKRVPAGLRLVKVTSVSSALAALRSLRDGGSPAGC
jgi:PDZ domain-containing protein